MSTSKHRALSIDVGTDGVTVVFEETPHLAWTVNCAMLDGRPRVTECSVKSSGPTGPFPLDTDPKGPPYAALAAHWAQQLGISHTDTEKDIRHKQRDLSKPPKGDPADHPEWDQHDLMDLMGPISYSLERKPDPRPYGSGHAETGRATDQYKDAVHEWSIPIAEVVRQAYAQNKPIQEEVRNSFPTANGKKRSLRSAEDLIRDARNAGHHLPSLRQTQNLDPNQ